jgi:DNA-3-methyladenine glycosylase
MMIDPGKLLSLSFYANPDVVDVSRKLLGKVLCSYIDEEFTSGIITETEAYCGRNDKACHANNGLRTDRTEVMYGNPGHAYIYLCYGIHHLFNVVTNKKERADAVLIRGIKPLDGCDTIKARRNIQNYRNLTNGPGKLTQALGITTRFNTVSLSQPPIWIEDRGIDFDEASINCSPRIGVEYAGEDAKKPWRFLVSDI